MKPPGLCANHLDINLRVPAARIGQIINRRRAITADTALRCQPDTADDESDSKK